jgi:uncharacterized membrane protein
MSTSKKAAEQAALRKEVRAQVEKKMRVRTGLNWHVAVFVAINLLLFVINQMFSPGVQWFIFPLFGWGLGLFFHAFAVVRSGRSEENIEKEVQRELERRSLHGH